MATSYEIHPTLGIARLGRSTVTVGDGRAAPDSYYLGPEPGVTAPASYRDSTPDRNLKRQAARFRIFKCERDADGKLTAAAEVGKDDADISWTVHLVNRKGAAPRFAFPLSTAPADRRNPGLPESDLVIDPGPKTVDAARPFLKCDGGRFLGAEVALGEVQYLPDGRLLVLGGFGRSQGPPTAQFNFANNDGWFDDTSDGTVRATVRLKATGEAPTVVSARVIAAPPDFAPGIANFITLYERLFDLATRRAPSPRPAWWPSRPDRPSFTKHVLPILARAVAYRWVNAKVAGAPDGHGPGGRGDFLAMTARLSAKGDLAALRLRQNLFRRLRGPDGEEPVITPSMPRLNDDTNGGDVLPMTATQYQILSRWADATEAFENDGAPPVDPGELLPDALDRVALEACVGGAFYPGIETSVPIYDLGIYDPTHPYRFTDDEAALPPGGLSWLNALPWQADFLDCSWDGNLGWWPSQRPDDVRLDPAAAPDDMQPWARGVNNVPDMIADWHRLGVVVNVGTEAHPNFVERERTL